jgi:hydrogenase expression/formation protein HypE
MGARPVALALGMVVEEGFPVEDLDRILASVKSTCDRSGVQVVTGDTKVVERGGVQGIITTTAGIGERHPSLDKNIETVRSSRPFEGHWPTDSSPRPGDRIIISGSVGDHGASLMSFREGYGFETELHSDTAPLNHMLDRAIRVGGVAAMKDPTRGGLANTLNEWCEKSHHGILVREKDIPMKPEVHSICELLGIDPYEVGNEGKAVLAVVPEKAQEVLDAIKSVPEGTDGAIIGEVTDDVDAVVLETVVGGKRLMDPPLGDPVPRIC